KTTTLMMLAGFEAPTAGRILLDGRSLERVPAHKRNMGMVFQNYALFPHMTVAENLAYPLRRRGAARARIDSQLRRAVEMVELVGLEDRYPAQLSGGQQQRVALARSLIFEPALVLMDEPLGALDKNLREQMQLEIKHLHDRLGMTVVYVTHDQGEALTMSDRVAVFHLGVVQQIDTPQRIYEQPQNSFVAGFIGENNTLQAILEECRGPMCRVRLRGGDSILARACEGVDTLRPGAELLVSVRPERIRAGSSAASGGGETEAQTNSVQATIVETIYFGDHLRLHAELHGESLTVKLPLAEMGGLEPGRQVRLDWSAQHGLALLSPRAAAADAMTGEG
ncbi:MAG: ABC transporter ATP-binding protein, partial [Gammaproteobacteria bacterium]|nr:ABC transporter ATP-binding protein [Gammaproteobacteria bacterium]